jgi:crotonobetainyl-CoA:carnitine CoA-transferase CaiB-like acyl-CoA transferase
MLNSLPLSKMKVLDLTHVIAGPYCTRLLAGFGAEVIKVEKLGSGDKCRRLPPFFHDEPDAEKSLPFLYLNASKKSITLNLKDEMGQSIFKRLVKEANIIVENFRPGVMESLGLSYEELKKLNPQLIMTSISNFGHNGQYRNFQGSELTLLAMGGMLWITGRHEKPIKLGGYQAQYMAGLLASISTLSAFLIGQRSKQSAHLDLSIVESVVASLRGTAIMPYVQMGAVMGRESPRFQLGHPAGIYPGKDGYVAIMPGWGGMRRLAQLMGDPELEKHDYFVNHQARVEHAPDFDKTILIPFFKEHDVQELMERAKEAHLPLGPVQDMAQLMNDPQLKARNFLDRSEHPVVGEIVSPGPPFATQKKLWGGGRAPLLGEHNEEVYGQLGYSDDDLPVLRANGVI